MKQMRPVCDLDDQDTLTPDLNQSECKTVVNELYA